MLAVLIVYRIGTIFQTIWYGSCHTIGRSNYSAKLSIIVNQEAGFA